MANEISKRDADRVASTMGVSSVDDLTQIIIRLNPTTKRLLADVLLKGYDTDGSTERVPTVIESTDTPGIWGLVVLNSDGSSVSTGGAVASVYGTGVYGTATYA